LTQIRLFGEPILVDFGEVILSSIIREVSQQDPADLRIRRRKQPLIDAEVFELFAERLEAQLGRLHKYWSIAGRQPGPITPPSIVEGDCRDQITFRALKLAEGSVDCVVTSPPYATALPYIDTDRLSLMAIMGLESGARGELETNLTGSREIRRSMKDRLESELMGSDATTLLPKSVVTSLRKLLIANRKGNVGFRRDNMASLLWRYFRDMHTNLALITKMLRPGGRAFYVVGDSRTNAGGVWTPIETCRHTSAIAEMVGLKARTLLDISVTTENYNHIKNAITENAVLEFTRPI
jgi:hypothetical protein